MAARSAAIGGIARRHDGNMVVVCEQLGLCSGFSGRVGVPQVQASHLRTATCATPSSSARLTPSRASIEMQLWTICTKRASAPMPVPPERLVRRCGLSQAGLTACQRHGACGPHQDAETYHTFEESTPLLPKHFRSSAAFKTER